MGGTSSERGPRRMAWLAPMELAALALNGFVIVVVNVFIYRARALYIERHGVVDQRPPTISRAISDPFIGEPFAAWITASAICLTAGVAILALRHARIPQMVTHPRMPFRIAMLAFPPALAALQAVSSIGMYTLSVYRFPFANEMHMAGSYVFFFAQAVVVILCTAFNLALLADKRSREELAAQQLILLPWLRIRCLVGLLSVALVLVYGILFKAKDFYAWEIWPTLYKTYTLVEPVVITSFLALLALMHAEILLRKR